jgi:hypothetical protein
MDFAEARTIASGGAANDVEAMAQRAADDVCRGIEAGFPGTFTTREVNLAALRGEELRDLVRRIHELVARHEPTGLGLSTAMVRLRDKATTKITSAQCVDGRIALELTGRCMGPTQICIIEDDDQAVRRRWRAVDAFEGRTSVRM